MKSATLERLNDADRDRLRKLTDAMWTKAAAAIKDRTPRFGYRPVKK